MPMLKNFGLNAVPFFAINAVGFPPNVIAYASSSHQISFIGGINKHFSFVNLSAQGAKRTKRARDFSDAFCRAVKPFVAVNNKVIFFYKIFKNLLSSVWFKNPHSAVCSVEGRCSLPFIAVFFSFLPFPRVGILIMCVKALVKFTRKAANDFFITRICKTQTSRWEPAQMLIGRHYDNQFAHFFYLNGGCYGSGSSSINNDIGFSDFGLSKSILK